MANVTLHPREVKQSTVSELGQQRRPQVAGSHILTLLRKLKMPVVTTLHTVLRFPDPDQRSVLEEITRLSDRVVVMSERAAQFLRDVYAVPDSKIDIIPHGVPDFQFMDPNYFKDKFGTEGKSELLTLGCFHPTWELRT
ncbi:MAG TPA: glycosyltransferase [Terracidiphilus sp.]|nr:glycosyltransferase [Terracidiphilus sp.]